VVPGRAYELPALETEKTIGKETEMADEDKVYLIEIIESVIARWCDFTGFGGDGVLATRIANAVEFEFDLVAPKEK